MRLVEIYLSTKSRIVFDMEIEGQQIADMLENRLADDKVLWNLLYFFAE